jgi:flagellar hook-length control protein FliK
MSANVALILSSLGPAAPAPPMQPAKAQADDGADFTRHLDRAKAAKGDAPSPKGSPASKGTEPKPNPKVAAVKGNKKSKDGPAVEESESDPAKAPEAGEKVDGAGDALADDSPAPQQPPQGEAKMKSPGAVHAKSESSLAPAVLVSPTALAPAEVPVTADHARVVPNQTMTAAAVTPGNDPGAASASSPAASTPKAEASAKARETATAFDGEPAKPQAAGPERAATVSPLDDPAATDPKVTAPVKPPATPAALGSAPSPEAAINPAAGAVEAEATDKHIDPADMGSVRGGVLAQGTSPTPPQASTHAPPAPELGALQVTVEMRDGTMNATFQTSNENATQLLSHSLGQLKTALEAQGVTVEKIQVQQAPKNPSSQNQGEPSPQQQRDEASARQEQQRKQMLQQMWRKVSGGVDPVDLVA